MSTTVRRSSQLKTLSARPLIANASVSVRPPSDSRGRHGIPLSGRAHRGPEVAVTWKCTGSGEHAVDDDNVEVPMGIAFGAAGCATGS